MGWFDKRFRKPTKYILQAKTGRGFKDLTEYDVKDYPTPPSISSLTDDLESEDEYHRIIAIYPSGKISVVEEYKPPRKARKAKGEFDWNDAKLQIKKSLEPLKSLLEIVNEINESLAELTGGGSLTKDDVREILKETGASGSDFWTGIKPPGWAVIFHPEFRQAEKELFKDIEDMIVNIADRVTAKMMESATGLPPEPTEETTSFQKLLDEELAKAKKPPETPKEKPPKEEKKEPEEGDEDESEREPE